MSSIATLGLLATATGARTMTGVAAVTRARSPRVANATAALATAELVIDKIPRIPDRTDPPALAGRMIAGAFIGASVARASGRPPLAFAAAGALLAFAGAQVSLRLRRALMRQLPPVAAAVVEDAIVITIAAAAARTLGPREINRARAA